MLLRWDLALELQQGCFRAPRSFYFSNMMNSTCLYSLKFSDTCEGVTGVETQRGNNSKHNNGRHRSHRSKGTGWPRFPREKWGDLQSVRQGLFRLSDSLHEDALANSQPEMALRPANDFHISCEQWGTAPCSNSGPQEHQQRSLRGGGGNLNQRSERNAESQRRVG